MKTVSDQNGNVSENLVLLAQSNLVPATSTNPLIERGIADLANEHFGRVQSRSAQDDSIELVTLPPLLKEIFDIGRGTGRCRARLARLRLGGDRARTVAKPPAGNRQPKFSAAFESALEIELEKRAADLKAKAVRSGVSSDKAQNAFQAGYEASSSETTRLEIAIPGKLSVYFDNEYWWDWETPESFELNPFELADEIWFERLRRREKLVTLNAPEIILDHEERLLDRVETARCDARKRPEGFSYHFESYDGSAEYSNLDQGIADLGALPRLELLDLSGCRLTDSIVSRLGDFRDLRCLVVHSGDFTDSGLTHLAALTRLEELTLGGRMLTDRGLHHLYGLTSLRWLSLARCSGLTSAGITSLRAVMKDCEVEWPDHDRPVVV